MDAKTVCAMCNVEVVLQASLRRNPAPDPRLDPSSVGSQLGALKFETGQGVCSWGGPTMAAWPPSYHLSLLDSAVRSVTMIIL